MALSGAEPAGRPVPSTPVGRLGANEPGIHPGLSTRIALGVTLVAALATGWASRLVPPSAVLVIVGLIVVAQLIGSLPGPAAFIGRWPTTAIGVGLIVVAIYLGAQVNFVYAAFVGAAALFVLSLDWNNLARLSLPLLLSLLVVTASLMQSVDAAVFPLLALWTAGVITTLALMERDSAAGGRRVRGLHDPSPTAASGSAASPAQRMARNRRLIEIASITLLVLLFVPLIASLIPDPGGSRSSRGGGRFSDQRQANPYWGFQDELDTSVRGDLGDEVVMRVRAPAPDLWRGTTFDRWDGRTWTKTTSPPRAVPGFGTVQIRPSVGDPPSTAADGDFTQVVTVEKAGSDLVFGAYKPTDVDMDEPATVDRTDGTVRGYGTLPAGAVYTVASSRPLVTADRLRAQDSANQPVPSAISSLYLPDDDPITPRVEDLARSVTASAPTTYDKVLALESWMGANTTYTRDAPRPPDGADAVDQFLFVDKRGFCEQIASSLAVMLRSQGIPTRVAVGYAPGERDAFTGEYVERGSDAHAWVEVWFPQTGWQAFDPTASVPLSGEFHESRVDDVLRILRALAWWLLAAAVVAAVAVVAVLLVRRRRRAHDERTLPWARLLTRRLLEAGAARDRPRRPNESLIEYGHRLAGSVLPDARVAEVARLLSTALFSARDAPDDRRTWATAVLDEVERANPARPVRKRLRAEAKAERKRQAKPPLPPTPPAPEPAGARSAG